MRPDCHKSGALSSSIEIDLNGASEDGSSALARIGRKDPRACPKLKIGSTPVPMSRSAETRLSRISSCNNSTSRWCSGLVTWISFIKNATCSVACQASLCTWRRPSRSRQDGNNRDQNKQEALKPSRMFSKIVELRVRVSYSRSAVCHLTERSQDPTPHKEGIASFLRTVDPSTRVPALPGLSVRIPPDGRDGRCHGLARGAPHDRVHSTPPKMCQTEHPMSAPPVGKKQEACHRKKALSQRLQASRSVVFSENWAWARQDSHRWKTI
jgi:hypothetical protein